MDINERNAICDTQGKRGVTGSTLADNLAGGHGAAILTLSLSRTDALAVVTSDFSGATDTVYNDDTDTTYTYGLGASFTCDNTSCR